MSENILKSITEKAQQLSEVREYLHNIEQEYNAKVEPKKQLRDKLTQELLAFLQEVGLKSVKTENGHSFARVAKKSVAFSDPDKVYQWAQDNGLLKVDPTLTKQKVAKLDELPEGFELEVKEYISVRK